MIIRALIPALLSLAVLMGAAQEKFMVNEWGMSQSARPRSQRRQFTFCRPLEPPFEIPADCDASSIVLLKT